MTKRPGRAGTAYAGSGRRRTLKLETRKEAVGAVAFASRQSYRFSVSAWRAWSSTIQAASPEAVWSVANLANESENPGAPTRSRNRVAVPLRDKPGIVNPALGLGSPPPQGGRQGRRPSHRI